MIVYVSLSRFYVDSGRFARAAFPVVVVKDKAVLDVNLAASERGATAGMGLREAKAILHDAKFVEWEPDEYREAQRGFLDACTEFTDVIEPEEQHAAYLDLSMHPDPGDILNSLKARLSADLGEVVASFGVARVKWMAKAALLRRDEDRLAYRYPKLFLADLPTALLIPVAPEHRERLGFLGYRWVGRVAELPLEVLQAQFGEEGLSIHRAAHGGMVEKVRAMYPLRAASARFSFESPVDSEEVLERGLAELAKALSAQLLENDLQGCDLSVRVEFEDGPDETFERNFAKPMQSATSVLFGLKLSVKLCDGEEARLPVRIRVRMPNLVRAARRQGNLYTQNASRQLSVAETAFDQMRKTFGTESVLAGSDVKEPRRKRVLQVWKEATGWV